LIIITDLTAYSFAWFGIKQPSVCWLLLGSIIGGILGIIKPIKVKITKVFFNFLTIAIIITSLIIPLLNCYLLTQINTDTCNF
jgi:hypothetical protein